MATKWIILIAIAVVGLGVGLGVGLTYDRGAPPLSPPTIAYSPLSFNFTATEGGANPEDQTLEIWNSGGDTLNWHVWDDVDWLSLSPLGGFSTGEHNAVTVSVNISGMTAGSYNATITITACCPTPTNSPQHVPVSLTIIAQDTLSVHFIDVGQGDAILIDYGTYEMLIDGGEKSPGVVDYLNNYVDGELEVMVATHPHADHIGGLIAVLDTFEVNEIWLNGDTHTTQTYSQFMAAVDSEGAEVHEARRGEWLTTPQLYDEWKTLAQDRGLWFPYKSPRALAMHLTNIKHNLATAYGVKWQTKRPGEPATYFFRAS